MTTVRVLISLATSKSWRLWQMDVQNSFLYGVSLHRSPTFSLPCIHTTRIKFHIQSNQPFIPHSKPSPKSPASLNASFPDLRLALKKKWRDSSRSYLGWLALFDLPFSLSSYPQFLLNKRRFHHIIYKRRPFEIGLVFSLLYYTEGVSLDIGKSYWTSVCFLSFFYSIRESLTKWVKKKMS